MDTVGRDAELEAIERWLAAPEPPLLLIEGEAGIGKSTIWREAMSQAEAMGFRTLGCSPGEAEAKLAFTVVRDLLGEAYVQVEGTLPPPQQRALAVTLLREESSAAPFEAGTIAVAFLACLRALSADQPTVVGVDDIQWVDDASGRTLSYALRRLRSTGSRMILARRIDGSAPRPLGIDRLVEQDARTLQIGPLSSGAVSRIVHDRVGISLPRPALRRLHEASQGNPFYALELARAHEPDVAPGEPLPVPTGLRGLVRARLESLPPETLDALAFVSATARPTLEILAVALDRDAGSQLTPALNAGVVELRGGDIVTFAHPLLGAAALDLTPTRRRREIHRRLADVLDTAEERARHLALAADGPDAEISDALERAAQGANRTVSAELYEAAARLTPVNDDEQRNRRALAAAAALFDAGDAGRAQSILEGVLDTTPDDGTRVEARVLLGRVMAESGYFRPATALWQQALDETDDAAAEADIRSSLATVTAVYLGPPTTAIAQANRAVAAAERSGDDRRLAYAHAAQAMAKVSAGDATYHDDLERAFALDAGDPTRGSVWDWSPTHAAAWCALRALDTSEMRLRFGALLERGLETGNADVEAYGAYGLAIAALAEGDSERAGELCASVEDVVEAAGMLRLPAARLRAEIDAHVGRSEEARARLQVAVSESAVLGDTRDQWKALAALGLLALAERRTSDAAHELHEARVVLAESGMNDPSVLLAFVDEVEAAAAADRLDQALDALAAADGHGDPPSWGLPLLLRARAAVEAGRGDLEEAERTLENALALEELAHYPVQYGRTLLALGKVQRRGRKLAAARRSLQAAIASFGAVGAALWLDAAASELGRIGGRAPSSGELTPTEERIAALVAEGKSNREVAATLVVSVHTVEAALTSIYRKLDVRSRTEMARKLVETATSKH